MYMLSAYAAGTKGRCPLDSRAYAAGTKGRCPRVTPRGAPPTPLGGAGPPTYPVTRH